MDHDPRFKTLIREFFADFLNLFFAEWAARFDLEHVEWLDKEVQADPPDDSLHILDLVAKVGVRDAVEAAVVLVHIEIESADRTTRIEPRLPDYYYRLRSTHQLPILPIVMYLKVGLDGVGVRTVEDSVLGFTVATINYLYVGLPGLDAVQYLEGQNYLGVALATLMKIPKERYSWLGAEAAQRVADSPLSQRRKYLLLECIDYYMTSDDATRAAFEALLSGEKYGAAQMAVNSYHREIEARGIAKGEHADRVNVLRVLAEDRFGPLPSAVGERIASLSAGELLQLIRRVPSATSLADLGLGE
jgi:hypothetical protein